MHVFLQTQMAAGASASASATDACRTISIGRTGVCSPPRILYPSNKTEAQRICHSTGFEREAPLWLVRTAHPTTASTVDMGAPVDTFDELQSLGDVRASALEDVKAFLATELRTLFVTGVSGR